MKWRTIRALLWKEWRETRWKSLLLVFALVVPMSSSARIPIYYLRNYSSGFRESMGMDAHYSIFLMSIKEIFGIHVVAILTYGLVVIALFSAIVVARELESRRIFLLFERPIQRSGVFLIKFLVGGFEVFVSIGISLIITTSVAYVMILKQDTYVTLRISWHDYIRLMGGVPETTLITGSAGVAVFALAFFLSVLTEKLWVGVVTSWISLILLFNFVSADRLLRWILRYENTYRDPVKLASVDNSIPLVSPFPLIALLTVSIAFYFAALYLFKRKELK